MHNLNGNILNLAIGALRAYSPLTCEAPNVEFWFNTALQGQAVIESVCVALVWNFSVVFGAVQKMQGKRQ